jgi:hypothetical protein
MHGIAGRRIRQPPPQREHLFAPCRAQARDAAAQIAGTDHHHHARVTLHPHHPQSLR